MKRKLYIRPTTDIVPILHCRLLDEWSANNGNGDGNGGTVDEDDELSASPDPLVRRGEWGELKHVPVS